MAGPSFRIRFEAIEAYASYVPDEKRGEVWWWPFKLRVFDAGGRQCFFAGVSQDDGIRIRAKIAELNGRSGEEAVKNAVVRWALRRTERLVRSGQFPTEGHVVEFPLRESDLPTIEEMVDEKTCRYQLVRSGDLFCSAADRDDPSLIVSDDSMSYAPTTRPVCSACDLPDTDALCSHFMHPRIRAGSGRRLSREYSRQIVGQMCDAGNSDEIDENPSLCRPGGRPCWERLVTLERDTSRLSPTELPSALDFLDTVWQLVFKRHIVRIRSVEAVASLVGSSVSRDDFAKRLSELADLLKLMEIGDDLLPEDKRAIPKDQTMNRLEAALSRKLGDENGRAIGEATRILRAINRIRWSLQHSGAAADLPAALAELGIPFPIEEHGLAWDTVRAEAANALATIRRLLQSTTH